MDQEQEIKAGTSNVKGDEEVPPEKTKEKDCHQMILEMIITRAGEVLGSICTSLIKNGRRIKNFIQTSGFVFFVVATAFICLYLLAIGYHYYRHPSEYSCSSNGTTVECNSTKTDAFYFAITTLSTIGYGDIAPDTASAKIICGIFMLLGLATMEILVAASFLCLLVPFERAILLAGAAWKTPSRFKEALFNSETGSMRFLLKVWIPASAYRGPFQQSYIESLMHLYQKL